MGGLNNLESIYLRPLSDAPRDGTIIGLVGRNSSDEESGVIDFVFYGVSVTDESHEAWFFADGSDILCEAHGLETSPCAYFGWFPVPNCEAPE